MGNNVNELNNQLKTRNDIINKIGKNYLTSNVENDEFSYASALGRPINGHKFLDIRFEIDNKYSILIEIKKNKKKDFSTQEIEQIESYMSLEREYKKHNNIIGILYNLDNQNIKVWKNEILLYDQITINSIEYYKSLFNKRKNSKENVIDTTNSLNETLHAFGIKESLRSQFVGCLLVALNNNLTYDYNLQPKEILNRIKEILENKIDNDENKTKKTRLLIKILDNQDIKSLKTNQLIKLLDTIERNLIPFIDSKTAKGEDLLNLFFTTFNKYVGKSDKNQAYTPTHITDFMCDITKVNRKSIVLDPTCGSGSFLVQAMSKMLADAGEDELAKENIKKNQLFGIEKEEKAFGLATTNMLVHEDGKSNVICESCFNCEQWIKKNNINIILMNPPFNGQQMPSDCPINKKKNMDATKGFYFVKYVADIVNKGYLATILPLQCAIGSDNAVSTYKKKMLENHTLKAVFSLNDEIFHPGASVNVCIMLFELGMPHNSNIPTFFGYYKNDGFIKKKNKGRVEKNNWDITKKEWLDLFFQLKEKEGMSVLKNVDYSSEWLAEAYMKTDYSNLTEKDFIQTIRDFVSFKVKYNNEK